IGYLKHPMTLKDLAHHVKKTFDVPWVRVTGDGSKAIKKVAVVGGSGEGYYSAALSGGADAYITGDMTFHMAQDAHEAGLSIIDPGHHVEKIMKKGVKEYLKNHISSEDVEIYTSKINTEPFSIQ
ncbi:MAG TPA: Nif3-like dinuclear metal center hexameric protein, partial [Bacillota bacterium]|nr:Nif3-like dinuclear metal center hexameric protein [Bacillota bacterium]